MGLLSTLGTIGGSLFGGPVGGAIGGAIGGMFDSSGSDSGAGAAQAAAGQTAAATNQATQLQREMWQAQQAQQRPFQQGGVEAQNRLMTLLGIGGKPPSFSGGGGGGFGILGGLDLSGIANAVNGPGINVDSTSPDYGKYARDFSMSDFQADPGYAFRLSEGQKALDRSAAARGGLISGAALKAATRYGQDMGSQEYQNAFNRYQTERNAQLNPLQSLAGVGQTSTNTLGSAGQNYASNVGNALMNQGYTQGNALIAGQQARQSTYGNIGTALGKVTPDQWSSARNTLSNWWSGNGSSDPLQSWLTTGTGGD